MTMIELTIAETDLAKILFPGLPCTFTRHTEAASDGIVFHVELPDYCIPAAVHHEDVRYGIDILGGPRLEFRPLADDKKVSKSVGPRLTIHEEPRRGW